MNTTLGKDVHFYVFLRLALLFSVLISLTMHQSQRMMDSAAVEKIYLLTAASFLFTTVIVYSIDRAKALKHFLRSQIAYDTLLTTALIYYSGAYISIFTTFYFLNIIFAALLFGGTGALATALASALCYSVISLINFNTLSHERLFGLLIANTAFLAVALLSGHLVEELLRGKQKISKLEKLSEDIVLSLDSGFLVLDMDSKVIKVNAIAADLLNSREDALLGKPVKEAAPVIVGRGLEVREIEKNGRTRKLLISYVPLPEAKSMVLLRDVTELLALEERVRRQERLASVGRLAAGVAHEIRNPLASIAGAAQLMADGSQEKSLVDLVLRESARVDTLVARLLQFTKPKAVERREFDLASVIDQAAESIQTILEAKGKAFSVRVSCDRPLIVMGDSEEWREVLNNLLMNAVQAFESSKYGKVLDLAVAAAKRDSKVELTVNDNGPGIPQEFQSRIFDPFFTTRSEGTGLGLAQVHRIIRDHDGTIDVSSAAGKGTEFKIRIPA